MSAALSLLLGSARTTAAGSLSRVITAPTTEDFDSPGYTDWIRNAYGSLPRKSGVNLITRTESNLTAVGYQTVNMLASNWTGGAVFATDELAEANTTNSSNSSYAYNATAASLAKIIYTFPATTTSRTAKVWFMGYYDCYVRAVLSDASATTIYESRAATSAATLYTFTYAAASAGQTLTVSIEFRDAAAPVSTLASTEMHDIGAAYNA